MLLSNNFVDNVRGILNNTVQLHHSHVTGEVIGYSHSYCNQKVRKLLQNTSSHPLSFQVRFLFLLKGLRSGVWRTKNIKTGGKVPTDVNFASIGNQIQFFDTIKYFPQSLGVLAESLTDKEKSAISKECEKIIKNDPKLSKKFLSCSEEEQKWVLNYLSTGKGSRPYEMITEYDSLDIVPDDGQFFLPHHFYSSLKDTTMSDEEYENVKKFY